jgi:hypothetical protein
MHLLCSGGITKPRSTLTVPDLADWALEAKTVAPPKLLLLLARIQRARWTGKALEHLNGSYGKPSGMSAARRRAAFWRAPFSHDLTRRLFCFCAQMLLLFVL